MENAGSNRVAASPSPAVEVGTSALAMSQCRSLMPFGFLQGQRSRLHRQARAGLDSAQRRLMQRGAEGAALAAVDCAPISRAGAYCEHPVLHRLRNGATDVLHRSRPALTRVSPCFFGSDGELARLEGRSGSDPVVGIHGCSVWFEETRNDHAIKNDNTPVTQMAVTPVSTSPPASGSAHFGESSRVRINILKTKAP